MNSTQAVKSSLEEKRFSGGGFSLIEVLVALVILAVGLLGLCFLQIDSLRGNRTAALRTQASIAAYDIVERMRANRDHALDGDYDVALGAAPSSGITVVDNDLTAWKSFLAQYPSGDGSVNVDSNGVVTIVVQLKDSPEAASPQQFQIETQL